MTPWSTVYICVTRSGCCSVPLAASAGFGTTKGKHARRTSLANPTQRFVAIICPSDVAIRQHFDARDKSPSVIRRTVLRRSGEKGSICDPSGIRDAAASRRLLAGGAPIVDRDAAALQVVVVVAAEVDDARGLEL